MTIPRDRVEYSAIVDCPMIRRSLDTIENFTGKRPVGWLGPGLTETYDTPEHLTAAGIKYIGDWVYDDEPTEISTANGPLVTLPYTVECNDIPMMIVQHHEEVYARIAKFKGVLHWNGEQILDWYLKARKA